MRVPIGGHHIRRAYGEARDLGLSFGWLGADGLTDDPRSIAIHDPAGFARSGLAYILTFSIGHPGLLQDGPRWCGYVETARDRLASMGMLDRCLGVQLGDEFYSHLHKIREDLDAAAVHVRNRAEDVRRIMGRHVGAGVGMAETGAVLPPVDGIDWWGLNVYLAHGYYTSPEQVAHIYHEAARLGRPIMPVLPLFADNGHPPVSVEQLASCYLPLLIRYASSIFALGVFCIKHPSGWEEGHLEGRGVVDLGEPYVGAVRFLTSTFGR